MKIMIGSTNEAKVQAVKEVFPEATVIASSVPSGVRSQPFSDEETKIGARKRASYCLQQSEVGLAIGLEGGVMFIGDQLYLCNWGALQTKAGEIFDAAGARIPLPQQITERLLQGKELGDVIDEYVKRKNIRHYEGAIGIFTNQLVNRKDLFVHIVQLLKGQYERTR